MDTLSVQTCTQPTDSQCATSLLCSAAANMFSPSTRQLHSLSTLLAQHPFSTLLQVSHSRARLAKYNAYIPCDADPPFTHHTKDNLLLLCSALNKCQAQISGKALLQPFLQSLYLLYVRTASAQLYAAYIHMSDPQFDLCVQVLPTLLAAYIHV